MKIIKSDLILIGAFTLIGILTRTIYHMGPNIEMVTALSITAPFFLKSKNLGYLVPLGIMVLSDLMLGNTIIFTFTWSAFLLSPFIGIAINKFAKSKSAQKKLFFATGGSLLSNIIFFLWTNFGVVLTTTMYDKNLAGIMQSYINALPFFRNQLVSGIVFTPIVFLATCLIFSISQRTNWQTFIEFARLHFQFTK
ncbi:hypothetical protein JW978_02345 [Candidatus Dojkabacteria bacterium]|nr:hypothetical protein [Candidatus Dojkabacteria bacterium]